MSGKSAETIQQLLEAEKEAAQVVEKARKERDERMKKATLEAEAEIAAYRESREKEYQDALAQFKSSAGDVTKTVQEREVQLIETIRGTAAKATDKISAQLVDWVCKVEIDPQAN